MFNLVMTMGMNLAHAVTPTLLKDLDMGPHVFGISFAAMCTTNFIFALIWSNLAHTMKKSRILMLSSIGYALSQIFFAYAQTEMMIYFARLLSGIFAGGFQVGFMSYIVNEAPVKDQARYITYSSVIVSVGAALGFFVGGYLGDISIRLTFFVQSGLHIILGLLFFFVLGPLESVKEHFDISVIKHSNPFKIIKESRSLIQGFTLMVIISVFVSSIGTTLFDQSFGYYVKEAFDFLPSEFGIVKAVIGLLALVLNAIMIHRNIKNQAGLLRVIFLLMAFFAILVSFQTQALPFVLTSVVWFGSYTVMIPVIQNLTVSSRQNVKEGNQLSGVYNAVMMLGKIFGALLTSIVYSINPIAPFWVSGILFLVSLALVMNRKIKPVLI